MLVLRTGRARAGTEARLRLAMTQSSVETPRCRNCDRCCCNAMLCCQGFLGSRIFWECEFYIGEARYLAGCGIRSFHLSFVCFAQFVPALNTQGKIQACDGLSVASNDFVNPDCPSVNRLFGKELREKKTVGINALQDTGAS